MPSCVSSGIPRQSERAVNWTACWVPRQQTQCLHAALALRMPGCARPHLQLSTRDLGQNGSSPRKPPELGSQKLSDQGGCQLVTSGLHRKMRKPKRRYSELRKQPQCQWIGLQDLQRKVLVMQEGLVNLMLAIVGNYLESGLRKLDNASSCARATPAVPIPYRT